MADINIQIDGKRIQAKPEMTILEVAQTSGIQIPTLCHHEQLEPFGGCRLCIVEIEKGGRKNIVVSCVYTVEEGIVVTTRNEKINRIRKTILELVLAHAPYAPSLEDLAKEYGADRNRYQQEASFCIHCGLCVRYCAEVEKKNAVGFVDRGINKEICFIPEIAATECSTCKRCFQLCPTSYLQATYVLAQSLAGLDAQPT